MNTKVDTHLHEYDKSYVDMEGVRGYDRSYQGMEGFHYPLLDYHTRGGGYPTITSDIQRSLRNLFKHHANLQHILILYQLALIELQKIVIQNYHQ